MPNFTFDAEDINKKIIDSMTSQLDSLFNTHADDEPEPRSPRKRSKTPVKPLDDSQPDDPSHSVKPFTAPPDDEPSTD